MQISTSVNSNKKTRVGKLHKKHFKIEKFYLVIFSKFEIIQYRTEVTKLHALRVKKLQKWGRGRGGPFSAYAKSTSKIQG